jgi:hypothetical protein
LESLKNPSLNPDSNTMVISMRKRMCQLQQEEMNGQRLTSEAISFNRSNTTDNAHTIIQSTILINHAGVQMKKGLTFLCLVAFAVLFLAGNTQAQIQTAKGDFFNITRTVEQTADSVTFIADTLTFYDMAGTVKDFQTGDSVVVMFVQNRFKIVNNMLSNTQFDYIKARVATSTSMLLSRKTYNGVVTAVSATGVATYGNDGNAAFMGPAKDIGIRPIYRPVGNIATSSPFFPKDPNAIRQVLSMTINNPSAGRDYIQLRNIYFKPNINNLTGLAVPPDTTKDTLRAYLLDGINSISYGDVIAQTDLAIVRLLPGTTAILMWINDSAQAVDAGEYIGSFGDYSRGRYFLGDDGLPLATTHSAGFRPNATRTLGLTTVVNPDYGMMIDGFPPERNPISLTNLYQALAPFWYTDAWPGTYPFFPNPPTTNPNPENGLIPPYRVGEYAVAHNPYQPGLVSSAVDTLRFLDSWGNRVWDRMTQPTLKALAYTQWNPQGIDRTVYLKGYSASDDTLRQYGQMVFRRLAYTHADVGVNSGGVEDSVRIVAEAVVHFTGQGGLPGAANLAPDTTGGFPRGFTYSMRVRESDLDNGARTSVAFYPEANRTPVDPMGINSLPPTGVKIVVRPNIPRAIDIHPRDQWKGTNDANFLRLDIVATDGYGNTVDDNEKFKFELSNFGMLKPTSDPASWIAYRMDGIFDSLITYVPNVVVSGNKIDSGRVFVTAANMGRASRVFSAATGSNNAGAYRIRCRMTYAFNDRVNDLSDPLKLDPAPGPGFAHINIIPDGSPNNNFGVWFGPNTGWNADLGGKLGQTTAMDSTDVYWDGTNWHYFDVNPRVEVVTGTGEALVVGSVGTFTLPGQPKNIYDKLYVRITDIYGNPLDIAPFFNAGNVKVELPDNYDEVTKYNLGQTQKVFFGSVSPNVAYLGAGGPSNPSNPAGFDPSVPDGLPNQGAILNAELVPVAVGFGLPGIQGDIQALSPYNAMRFYVRAPKNVKHLGLDGVDKMRIRAHLTLNTGIPYVGDVSVMSGFAEVSIIPDVVQNVEIFKSWGKPQGTTVPMEGWSPISTNDALAAGYPTGTPRNAAETNEFYKGYFFRAIGAVPPTTGPTFPTPLEPVNRGIGGFLASDVSLDGDCTSPIPMDTVVVSEHNQQMRIVARLLDQYNNPIGGRYVKFAIEGETLPVTLPKTQLQNNAQRGGFGEFNKTWVADDTLKRTTIGDTAQAGWVTAYFVSGRVGWQFVRIALTPDTLAFDLSPKGMNLGEGTIVGESRRGYAPRVIIPIYQKSDTTVKVAIFPYTAAATSPVPLPTDLVYMQALEHVSIYPDSRAAGYAPYFQAYSTNPFFVEQRASHIGRMANTAIRPYIPDTLNLTDNDRNSINSVTAGRSVALVAREYDRFGNLVDNQPHFEDTARVRFRMWGDNWSSAPAPYTGAGTIVPYGLTTQDEWGPVRKARYRHTQISNLVSGVHINQTAFCITLELPTPKTADATFFIEATATAVLPPGLPGPVNLNRDTCKIVSVTKSPTRFDILRAGQEYQDAGAGIYAGTGTPEQRTINLNAPLVSLPPGADLNLHKLDETLGLDNIMISQAYKRNISEQPVGKYYVVNDDNVPLDRFGHPLFTDKDATGFNPDFEVDPASGRFVFAKLDAYNNRNTLTTPSDRFNRLNNLTQIPGARQDAAGYLFDITIAGGGAIVDPLNYLSLGYHYVCNQATGQDVRVNQRPILVRVTPLWENYPPKSGGAAIEPSFFAGKNAQPGQTKIYEDVLYSDSVYTYSGTASPSKNAMTRLEFMGTWSDRGRPGSYAPQTNGEFDRLTRIGIRGWDAADYTMGGFPGFAKTGGGPGLSGGADANNVLFNGDFNRRWASLGGAFGRGTGTLPILPGAFIRIIDSTAEQVVEFRVVAADLTDKAGRMVDDTNSYYHGKWSVVRRAQRVANSFWHIDDTYWRGGDGIEDGIQGPNMQTSFTSEFQYSNKGVPPSFGANAPEAAATRAFFGISYPSRRNHYFVVVPYRIAYTALFPSSYDPAQGLFDNTRLPLGILPIQADIDTLPRVALGYYSGGQQLLDITQFEMYTRLYGQIRHGATDQIPNNSGTPYARPDTVFRDIRYTYNITPYDRYGNLNTRDTMYIQVGSRTTDWNFRDLESDGSLKIRTGGNFFGAIPVNTPFGPDNTNMRQDTIRILNPVPASIYRNEFIGIKPDDPLLSIGVGGPRGVAIPHGLMPANVIASRPVWVKQAFAPKSFVLSTALRGNTTLFRLDHVGGCANNGLEQDILRLQWESATYAKTDPKWNPNDTVKYEWYAIIDSVGTGGGRTLTVSILADNNGINPSLTLPGDKLRDLIFRPGVQPQPNLDSLVMRIKWFVRAYNKTGMSTYSDTAGATIRNTPAPTPPLIISINRPPENAPTPISPVNNATISGITATTPPIDILWTAATDVNINKGKLIGGFKVYNSASQTWIDDPSGRTVDTLFYQWIGTVVRTFPAGKGAAPGTMLVKNSGSLAAVQLNSTDLDMLFGGFSTDPASTSADSVIIDWQVYVKDFEKTDMLPMEDVTFRHNQDGSLVADTTLWSRFGCRPHELFSNLFRLNLTKLDQGGVEIDPMSADPDINATAGDAITFKLTARDKNGNIIRDWNIKGQATTLTIRNSTANTDSSTQSWNSNPLGYSWAVIYDANNAPLTTITANEFSIPASAFVDGVAYITIKHTKAESGVQIEVTPTVAGLDQMSAKMNFTVGVIADFFVDLTSATSNPNQVYLMRIYEIYVAPRDQYKNVTNATVKARFTARFPGEFESTLPGLSDIFSGEVFITGPTNYFLASRIARIKGLDELQTVRCYLVNDNTVYGETAPYEILTHAPNAFALQAPVDHTILNLMHAADPELFTWQKTTPQDPYTNIVISRFSANPNNVRSDEVLYEIAFVDSISLTRAVRYASDGVGKGAVYTTNHGQLSAIINTISGRDDTKSQQCVWFVEATDGLSTTLSTPPNADPNGQPGYHVTLNKEGILAAEGPVPAEFALTQNYPNPFNPTTSISYSLPTAAQVTLTVYDLLGTPVKTLVSQKQDAGTYTVNWNASNDLGVQVPSGNYIYKIVAGSFTQTRKMTLLK